MRKFLLVVLGAVLLIGANAQDETIKGLKNDANRSIKKDPNDTVPAIWKKGGIYNLNISQGSLSNWAAGGDAFSLSINSALSLFAFYKKDRHSWDNTFDFNLGYIKTTSLGERKNDDRIDLLSKYGYGLTDKLNLSALFNFRSQLFNGYNYDNNKELTSAFLSPAYVLLSPGLDYKPTENFSLFVSPITSRWVIVKNPILSAAGKYGVDSSKTSNYEIGAFLSANYLKEGKIVTYKGRLDLFSNYRHNPQNVDLYMSNILAFKISKVLSASYSLDLIYDDDAKLFGPTGKSPALQVKSLIGIGLALKF